MANATLPTPEVLCQLLRYEPETGKLFWKRRSDDMFPAAWRAARWNERYAETEAFTAIVLGYRKGSFDGKQTYAHRVVWAITHGEWPEGHIDHINGNRADNRLANLRVVSNAENGKNQKFRKNNTSGVVGVSWDKRRGLWFAHICSGRKLVNLGRFKTMAEAVQARERAELELGFHPNHGRR
jgi:hypothetical protein